MRHAERDLGNSRRFCLKLEQQFHPTADRNCGRFSRFVRGAISEWLGKPNCRVSDRFLILTFLALAQHPDHCDLVPLASFISLLHRNAHEKRRTFATRSRAVDSDGRYRQAKSRTLSTIGLPTAASILLTVSGPSGTSDADIMVTISANHHPADNYIRQLRLTLRAVPGVTFASCPPIWCPIPNFGLPAPIDVRS